MYVKAKQEKSLVYMQEREKTQMRFCKKKLINHGFKVFWKY